MIRIPGPPRSEWQEHLYDLHFALEMADKDHDAAENALQRSVAGEDIVELKARVRETADHVALAKGRLAAAMAER